MQLGMSVSLLCFLGVLCSTSVAAAEPAPPKLILQITVDQLRGDLPRRFLDRMGDGGFRYLLEQGVVFNDAHHAHANTETIVGHTTLATGAHPSAHGLAPNRLRAPRGSCCSRSWTNGGTDRAWRIS